MCNNPVPAGASSEMYRVTSLLDASAISWMSDQGMVILQQLVLLDESLACEDILGGTYAKIVFILSVVTVSNVCLFLV